MLEMETKELEISEELKRKVEMICKFALKKYTLTNGCIVGYKGTNVGFAKPHILRVDDIDYLIFENHDYIYINGYIKRIPFNELSNHIKNKIPID